MIGYVVRRVVVAAALLVLLSVVTFALYYTVPANPAGFLVDMERATPAEIAKAERALGVDEPAVVQYGRFIRRAVRGDFGYSWATVDIDTGEGYPVSLIVGDAARVTASLVGGGIVLVLLLAIPLGSLVATRPRGFLDRLVLVLSLAAISTHPLVVGLLLRIFAGTRWELFPAAGYCPLFAEPVDVEPRPGEPLVPACGGVVDWARHLVMPWVTFALFFAALYIRMMRTQMIEVLGQRYISTARAKGASEGRIVSRHALRNAIAPIVTMAGMDAGMAIGIALYVETVFILPGLGRMTIAALAGDVGYDLPVLLATVLVIATAIILLNLLVDLVVRALDPRIAATR